MKAFKYTYYAALGTVLLAYAVGHTVVTEARELLGDIVKGVRR